jgi:hypothetical protein
MQDCESPYNPVVSAGHLFQRCADHDHPTTALEWGVDAVQKQIDNFPNQIPGEPAVSGPNLQP